MLIVVITASAFGQKATLINDTVTYKNTKLYPAKEVQLQYGSNPDKEFAFVLWGHGWSSMTLGPQHSNVTVIVTEIAQHGGKYYAIGKLKDRAGIRINRIIIDVEGAIDYKEIKAD